MGDLGVLLIKLKYIENTDITELAEDSLNVVK